jgi:hypothetical protein
MVLCAEHGKTLMLLDPGQAAAVGSLAALPGFPVSPILRIPHPSLPLPRTHLFRGTLTRAVPPPHAHESTTHIFLQAIVKRGERPLDLKVFESINFVVKDGRVLESVLSSNTVIVYLVNICICCPCFQLTRGESSGPMPDRSLSVEELPLSVDEQPVLVKIPDGAKVK